MNIFKKHRKHSLTYLLKHEEFPEVDKVSAKVAITDLQIKMLRIQQGVWHSKKRVVLLFEGFDAAGKGGAIRRITENLDPRGVRVHPIGPPKSSDIGKHYLARFWRDLPEPGRIAIFDRSWYGRVLVERVEKLIPKARWSAAYEEINQFESMLLADGIDLVKVFLAIHPKEQLRRFEARLKDPYKQWKLSQEDLDARGKWKHYVEAGDELFFRTHLKSSPWNLIRADSKDFARNEVLRTVTGALEHHGDWMDKLARKDKYRDLRLALKQLEKIR